MDLEKLIEKLRARQQKRIRLSLICSPEETRGDERLHEINRLLGLNYLSRSICSRSEIDDVLLYSAEDLKRKLEGKRTLPTPEEIEMCYNTFCEHHDAIRIRDYNAFYPMLGLCFDEKFLVLTNFILTSPKTDKELKREVADLAEEVIECAFTMTPVEEIKEPLLSEREFNKLSNHTSRTIRKYERELRKEERQLKKERKG